MSWPAWSWASHWVAFRSRLSLLWDSSNGHTYFYPRLPLELRFRRRIQSQRNNSSPCDRMKTQAWTESRYIDADGRSRPSLYQRSEPSAISFLSGLSASSFTARAVEHDEPLLFNALGTCGQLPFRKTLARIGFRAVSGRVFALRRKCHRRRGERFAEPAQGYVHVRFTRRAGTTGCFEMADSRGASPVRGGILLSYRAAHFVVVRRTSAGCRTLQCSKVRME